MVFRIVLDFVRRKKLMVGLVLLQGYLFGKAVWQIWPGTDGLPVAMAGAGFLQLLAGSFFQSRELFLLPVSRRTWWRASWWLAVLGSASIATAAVTLGRQSAGHPLSLDEIVMTALASFLFSGLAAALHAAFRRVADAPATPRAVLAVVPLFAGLMAGPFLVAPYLPHTFGAITPLSAMLMAAAVGVAVRGYLHHPPIEPRLVGFRNSLTRMRPNTVPGSRAAIADRLTGWHLVVWDESRNHLITFSSVIALIVVGWALTSQFRQLPALAEFLRLVDALPFASRAAHITEPITWGCLFFISNFHDSWMVRRIRPLRTLPMSSTLLACLPLALSLVSTCMLWAVMLVLHFLVVQNVPVSLRVDLFVAFSAVTACSLTIRFLTSVPPATRTMLGLAPIAIIWLALGFFDDSWKADIVQSVMLMGGVLVQAGSFVAMRHVVARSSRLYRVPALT